MGRFDHVVVLDEVLRCPHGHPVSDFQTKSFDDPSMDTYLFDGPRVHRVARGRHDGADDAASEHWRLDGDAAVFHRRHAVGRVVPSGEVVFYTSCGECPPVLIRSDRPLAWGDLVAERRLWVEFRAIFGPGESRRIERTSGTRDDLAAELRDEGLRVLRDDEPLAIAHFEIRAARDQPLRGRRGRR
jgi:hypothetical protein